MTLTELGKLCCIDKSTVTKIVKKLGADGYLQKPTDAKRGYFIALTDKGRELNTKTMDVIKSLNDSASDFLTADEMQSLNSLMNKLLKISEDKILSEIESRISGDKEDI